MIWDFPSHHVSLGWWLAAILTLWNFVSQVLIGILGQLSILSREFRAGQIEARIRALEYLHDNTNRLVRSLATDVIEIAIEICYMLIAFIVLFVRVIPITTSAALFIISLNVSSSVIGRAWRIKRMLYDLNNYEVSLQKLRLKLSKLKYQAEEVGSSA